MLSCLYMEDSPWKSTFRALSALIPSNESPMRLELPHPIVGKERGSVVSVARLLLNVRGAVLSQLRADLILRERGEDIVSAYSPGLHGIPAVRPSHLPEVR